jgi:hypothetical protein
MSNDNDSDPDCLHCKLTKVIEEHCEARIASGLEMDVTDIAAKIVEALGQFLLEAIPDTERANMIAISMEHLGRVLLAREEGYTRH